MLQELAVSLEHELHAYIIGGGSSSVVQAGLAAAAAAAARRGSSDPVQEYKSRARMLCTGLRYEDGISPQLIAGEREPREVGGSGC